MRKARVFISCGQRTEREKSIGYSVDKYFQNRGFDTYFADRVHSPDALTENIFRFLRSSEYYIFIDFRRESIKNSTFRGSLFVNQELGIATFLQIPGLGFVEKGVFREGILGFQIWNALDFEDGTQIISQLEDKTKNWDPNSVNELHIEFNPDNVSRNIILRNNDSRPVTDWYHLSVCNRNKNDHALSCLPYLSKIENIDTNKLIKAPSIELIWSGLGDYVVNIISDTDRKLDAFFVMRLENDIRFNHRSPTTTAPEFWMPVLQQGTYRLEYTVISANFPKASRSFILEYRGDYNGVTFRPE